MGIENKNSNIVILAKSRKHSAYCIAGVDCNSNKLVRVITDNEYNHYAVVADDIEDDKGKVAEVYDNIIIKTIENKIEVAHQPENIMLDTRHHVTNKGPYKREDLRKIINKLSNKYEYIFYNSNKCISQSEFEGISEKERHSLEIINAEYLTIRVKDIEKKTLKASIKYNGVWYNSLSITDCYFESRYYEEVLNSPLQHITLNNPYVLVSLGENFNGNYYKLIACILSI